MEGILAWNERDGTYYVTLNYDLDLGFSIWKFKKDESQERVPDWYVMKEMWVDRMLDPFCALLAMTLTLDFQGQNFDKALCQEWNGQLTWKERDISR